jgi:hypothetical protein
MAPRMIPKQTEELAICWIGSKEVIVNYPVLKEGACWRG